MVELLIIGENMDEKLGLNLSLINGENINGNEDCYGLSPDTHPSPLTHLFCIVNLFFFCLFFLSIIKVVCVFVFRSFVKIYFFILTFVNITLCDMRTYNILLSLSNT